MNKLALIFLKCICDILVVSRSMLFAFCPRPLCHPLRILPHVNPGEACFRKQHKLITGDLFETEWELSSDKTSYFSLAIGYSILITSLSCLLTAPACWAFSNYALLLLEIHSLYPNCIKEMCIRDSLNSVLLMSYYTIMKALISRIILIALMQCCAGTLLSLIHI